MLAIWPGVLGYKIISGSVYRKKLKYEMDNLKEELKKQIIEQLNLEELQVSDIADDALLFSADGIGLDSIDALELIVLLEKFHGIQVTNPEEGKEAFLTINTLADYIRNRKG
jgi:acyl carrier protein